MPNLPTEQSIGNRQSSIDNPQWDRAIIALLTQPSIVAAAQACGLGESTLRRWLHQPDFAHVYSQARQQAFSVALGYLQHLSEQAVKTLQSLMQDPHASPSVRLSAARTVLQMSFKGAEMSTFQTRLDQLENAATTLEEEQEDSYPLPQSQIENRQSTSDNPEIRSNPLTSSQVDHSLPPSQRKVPCEAGTPASGLGQGEAAGGEKLEGIGEAAESVQPVYDPLGEARRAFMARHRVPVGMRRVDERDLNPSHSAAEP